MCNENKTLSVIIPVYNEEATVVELLEKVRNVPLPFNREIIVVNDGSTDSSPRLIREWAEKHKDAPQIRIISIDQENGGKGSAVRSGIQASAGDVVIIQDADLEYDPGDYPACALPVMEGRSAVVYGSRELKREREFSHKRFFLGGLLVTNWMNMLYGSEMTDEPTCYKTFDGDLIRALSFESDGFEWEPEISAKLLRLGFGIDEVPVNYNPRKLDEGKKIRWTDGVKALWTALKWRFLPVGNLRYKLPETDRFQRVTANKRKESLILLLIVVLAVLLRIALALPGLVSGKNPAETFFRPDSPGYVGPASSLAETGSYNTSPESLKPATQRPPGFPACLALIFAVFGQGLKFPVIIFCLTGALIAVPVFYTGKLFGSFAPGALAGLLFASNITAVALSPLYLSDTLFTLLAAVQLYFFSRFYFYHRLPYVLFAVFFAGLAVLVRPVGLLWIIPCLFLILIMPRLELKKKLAYSLFSLLLFCAVIFPWMLRNWNLNAGFAIDSNTGNILYHNGAVLLARAEGGSPEEIRQRMMREVESEFRSNPEKYSTVVARERYEMMKMRELVMKYPLTYISLHFRPAILIPDAATFFELLGFTRSGRGTFDVLNRKGFFAAVNHYFEGRIWLPLLAAPFLVLVIFTYIGSALQLIIWIFRKKIFLVFFFLAFVEYYLLLPGPVTMPRYHIPSLPLMCVMAAMAFFTVVCKLKIKMEGMKSEKDKI